MNKNDLSFNHAKLDLSVMTATNIIAIKELKESMFMRMNKIRNDLSGWYISMKEGNENTCILSSLVVDSRTLAEQAKDLNTVLDMLQHLRGAQSREEVEVVKTKQRFADNVSKERLLEDFYKLLEHADELAQGDSPIVNVLKNRYK